MVQKWRKKPVVIEALQWTGENKLEVLAFCGTWADIYNDAESDETICEINTMEGIMTASVNDYIIKGVNGEFYPCKPSIFAKTYELVPYSNMEDNREAFFNK
jgi:hypothetical protein